MFHLRREKIVLERSLRVKDWPQGLCPWEAQQLQRRHHRQRAAWPQLLQQLLQQAGGLGGGGPDGSPSFQKWGLLDSP